jgi:hypothetical protein
MYACPFIGHRYRFPADRKKAERIASYKLEEPESLLHRDAISKLGARDERFCHISHCYYHHQDLEHNILSTLGGFQRYAQCSHNLYEYLKMPVNAVKAAPSVAAQTATYTSHSYTDTLVWIALLSQIEWDSTFGARTIQALDNVSARF